MSAQEILQALRTLLGLPDLTFNEDGVCCIYIPGELEIQIEWDPDSRKLIALGSIGPLGDDPDGSLARSLLAANFLFSGTRGESLSLEPDTRKVFLCAAFSVANESAAPLIDWFEGFVDTAQHWRQRLQTDPANLTSSLPPGANLVRG